MTMGTLAMLSEQMKCVSPVRWQGRVLRVLGNLIESAGPMGAVGSACEIRCANGRTLTGEIIGFRGGTILSMTTEDPAGVRLGDPVVALGHRPSVGFGAEMVGRVLDARGLPMDSRGMYRPTRWMELDSAAPLPMERMPIREALGSGVRVLDGFVPCGRGQRLGVFGGSGVGKSTLLGMMARGTDADVIVMALVGERGREVAEFLEVLGQEGRARSVVVVSTSNEPPLLRLRAPMLATAVAEGFAAQGKNVLLVVDSLTRFAMAQREIGLAAGEPPTTKGYTPSVVNKLACLVERAGRFRVGSITAFYTVLMEGDDQQDPIVDTVRSLLDGHIVLDRALALEGHYPPVSVLDSLSRLMPNIATAEHQQKARDLRRLMAAYARSEDLIRIGAYQRGADQELDRAVEVRANWMAYLRQDSRERCPLEDALEQLRGLPS